MVVIDTSAWIEYFRGGVPSIVRGVDSCLKHELVVVGDLIYCEVMQGIREARQRKEISALLLSLPCHDMVGFEIANRAAENYRLMRARGVTVRKTIDVFIGTFCVQRGFQLLHFDRDFDHMAPYIGLDVWKP